MKKFLHFHVDGGKPIEELLSVGLQAYSGERAEHGRFSSLCLLLRNGSAVKIESIVTTVKGWDEVGTLVFFPLTENSVSCISSIPLSSDWNKIVSVEKLVLNEGDFYAESGIVIKNAAGEEVIIVSSEYPYALELLAPFFSGDFRPEYELSAYSRKKREQ